MFLKIMYGLVTDKIERQIRKNKTKIERKNRNKFLLVFTDVVEDSDVAQAKLFVQNILI